MATKAKTVSVAQATKFRPPKSLAECADMLYTTRQQRLALNKQADEFEGIEKQLKNHLVDNLPVSNATGISGSVANVKIENGDVYIVEDWEKFYGYILAKAKKNPGIWALLNKAVNQATAGEMWGRGEKPPGMNKLIVKKVSCTKVS